MFWMRVGHRTSAIYRLAAKAHKTEWTKREEMRRARKPADSFPPLVWALTSTPVGDRRIDEYIARAKELYEQEGRQLAKEPASAFGVVMARLNTLYAHALAEKRFSTCERLIRLHAELFGIPGSIQPMWLEPDAGATDDVPEVTTTEEQAEREMRALVDTAMRRLGADPKSIKWIPGKATN